MKNESIFILLWLFSPHSVSITGDLHKQSWFVANQEMHVTVCTNFQRLPEFEFIKFTLAANPGVLYQDYWRLDNIICLIFFSPEKLYIAVIIAGKVKESIPENLKILQNTPFLNSFQQNGFLNPFPIHHWKLSIFH